MDKYYFNKNTASFVFSGTMMIIPMYLPHINHTLAAIMFWGGWSYLIAATAYHLNKKYKFKITEDYITLREAAIQLYEATLSQGDPYPMTDMEERLRYRASQLCSAISVYGTRPLLDTIELIPSNDVNNCVFKGGDVMTLHGTGIANKNLKWENLKIKLKDFKYILGVLAPPLINIG